MRKNNCRGLRRNTLQSIDQSESIVGFKNIGNTCYMNSALQCMFHTDIIRDYFCLQEIENEINDKNPLGT